MDPLSITAACSSLAFALVRNGRALATVFEKYQGAQHSIFMIQTECTVLAAALSQLESAVSRDKSSRLANCPPAVIEALDLSLTGCTLTLSVLEKEINKLVDSAAKLNPGMGKSDKAKFVWKEVTMNELLQQLRGQSSALTLLLKALDSSSIDQILGIVRAGQPTFQKIRKGSIHIRQAFPKEKYAESILDMPFDDSKTIYSLESNTTESSKSESWDDSSTIGSAESKSSNPQKDEEIPPGWERVYSVKYNQWYYVNKATKNSQWAHPGLLSPPKSPSDSARLYPRTPSPNPATPSTGQRPLHETVAAFSKLGIKDGSTQESKDDEIVDLTPWLLNTPAKLERELTRIRTENKVPAMVVGIVSAHSPPELFVSGLRRNDKQVAVTRADKFPLAMNDWMTNTILTMLVDRGFLTWDRKLVDCLPASISKQAHTFHKDTTFAMFASSRSGIAENFWTAADGSLKRYLSRSDVASKPGRIAIALYYLGRPPDHTPGTEYQWHQANAPLIALAIETIINQPFEHLLKTLLFDPLEMYSAGFGWPDMERNSAANPTQPYGHYTSNQRPVDIAPGKDFNMNALYPVQGVHCSAADYAAYVQFELRCYMGLETKGLISAAGMKTAVEEVGVHISNSREWAKGTCYSQVGYAHGMCSDTWIAPLIGKAFFAISNMDRPSGAKANDDSAYTAILYARDSGSEQ